MKKISNLSFWALLVSVVTLTSCDKNKPYKTAVVEPLAHFAGNEVQSYSVVSASTAPYRITIGTTDVSKEDRTVSFTVSSPTGATAGTHYTLSNTTGKVTIPAGEAVAYIDVQGIFAAYETSGRKDTVIFKITEPDVKVAEFQHTLKLFMRGPCFEGDIVLDDLKGDYKNTHEVFGTSTYGPYTTSVSAVSQTSATTGTVTITNIYDYGWNPITFKLDWTNPNNRLVTLDYQSGVGNAGTLNSAYAGNDIQVDYDGVPGTYSWCDQTIQVRMAVGVVGLGWFGNRLIETLNR
ncbi:MAG: hypothetical protein NVV59_15665 [Chitinophagaceae bacterium]|nr:hypothetical protein [Chitinophagaceae bacterium]